MQVLTSSCQILDSAGFNKQLPALQCTLYTYVTLFTPTNTNGFWVSARLLGDLDYKGGGLLERTYCIKLYKYRENSDNSTDKGGSLRSPIIIQVQKNI